MTNGQKFSNAVGLAMKAGRIKYGDSTAEPLVREGKAKLVLLDSQCSKATVDRYRLLCERRNVPLLTAPDIGTSIGKDARKVLAVTDVNFAEMIQNAYARMHQKTSENTAIPGGAEEDHNGK